MDMSSSSLHIEMDESGKDRQPNPLLIPLVLEKVFEHVDLNDLATCRKVCRTWEMEAKPLMRKRCCIKFTSIDQVKSYIEDFREVPPEVHEVYQFGALAISRYRGFVSGIRRARVAEMMDINATNPIFTMGYRQLCQDVLRSFFNIFGNTIKILELDSDFDMDIEELSRVLMSRTDNLESLSMTIRNVTFPRLFLNGIPFTKPNLTTLSLRSDVGMVPVSLLRDFFTMAPNLRKITCLPLFCANKWKYSTRQPRPGRIEFIRVLFHTIVMGPQPPVLSHLSNLDINLQLTEVELQGLITKAYPLNSIKLGICADVQGRTLGNLLSAGRNLLVRVSLNFHPNSNAASYGRYDFQLQELRYLCLCGFKAPVSFIRNSPALKTLIVANAGDLSRTFPVHEIAPHDLENLFVQWDNLEDPDIIGRITQCFPRLKTFAMRKGNDAILREIYLSMPYLQSLTILGGGVTDAGITGINEIVYQDIAESGSLSMADPGKLRTSMSIGSLSRLRKLHLESDLITDVSIFLGIGSCLNLKHLRLECSQLTDYCLLKIAKFPYLTTLNVISCLGLTMENKLKLKNEFRAQGRQVSMEWTPEEVLRESQKRALVLPELPHDYYQQALLGIPNGGQADVDEHGIPLPIRPPLGEEELDDSSDSDDDPDPDGNRANFRRRMRMGVPRREREFFRNHDEIPFGPRNPHPHRLYNPLRRFVPRPFHEFAGIQLQRERQREELQFGAPPPPPRDYGLLQEPDEDEVMIHVHPIELPEPAPVVQPPVPPQEVPIQQQPAPDHHPAPQVARRGRILRPFRERFIQVRVQAPVLQDPELQVNLDHQNFQGVLHPPGPDFPQIGLPMMDIQFRGPLFHVAHAANNLQPPNANHNVNNRPQIGPQHARDYPPQIPADLDALDDVEM